MYATLVFLVPLEETLLEIEGGTMTWWGVEATVFQEEPMARP